jgi:putative oligomerization/nucleic acid binding protein
MVGRHWETAEATIVATQVAVQTAAGYVNRLEYAVDVHPANGPVFRATLREPKFIKGGFSQPAVGDTVGVLFDVKSKDAKFDTSDPRLKISVREDAKRAAFEAAASASPGAAAPGIPNQMQVLSGSDAAPILNALFSSDSLSGLEGLEAVRDAGGPAARLEKLEDLKAKGLVSDAEYETQRQKIIDAV